MQSRPSAWRTVVVGFAGAIIACGETSKFVDSTSKADSDSPGSRWSVTEQPLLVLGEGNEPGADLYRVQAATRTATGTIAVANGATAEVKFFGQDGNLERVVGSKGGGPEEFTFLADLTRSAGDTLLALVGPKDVARFSAEGEHLGKTTFESSYYWTDSRGQSGYVLPNGNILTQEDSRRPDHGRFRPETLYVLLRPDREGLDSIAWLPGIELIAEPGSPRRGGTNAVAFSPNYHIAIAPDRLFLGDSHEDRVEVYNFEGVRIGQVALPHQPRRVTRRDQDEYVVSFREMLMEQPNWDDERARYERMLRDQPFADVFPTFGTIAADREGNLWVQDYSTAADLVDWTVYDRAGNQVARVALPTTVRILEIGMDYLLALKRSELGVETVQMFGLER